MLIGLTVAKFQRKIFTAAEVSATLVVDKTGTQLGDNADVKIRGIVVGRVAEQHSNGTDAVLSLKLKTDKAKFVPRNVRARLLPKTLFGEKYVDLVVPPEGAATEHVRNGDTIEQDTSRQALEVERVLADLFPLLRALEPEKLNRALTAIAEGLQGRGDQLGQSLANLDAYLGRINAHLPAIQADISGLADLAESLDANAEDILRIARNAIVSGGTLTSKDQTLASFLRGTTGFTDQLTELLQRNGDGLIYLSDATRRTIATVYPKRDVLPGTVKGLNEMLTKLNAALNHGPALSIRLEPVQTRGAYLTPCSYPGPDYSGGCPIGTGEPTSPVPPPPNLPDGLSVAGQPGSPEERDAVRRLIAPDLGVDPEDVPDLAVLLLTPLMRGTLVTTP
jgi:phospholipid/cholesterol/gamma-HCH transport system substrate-binding protein